MSIPKGKEKQKINAFGASNPGDENFKNSDIQ